MTNQVICIYELVNHLLCTMQCCLNGMQISEVPKFLIDNSCETKTTHAIALLDPFDATHPLIILLQMKRVTSYFDVNSPSVAEYENDEIPKIHLTAEKPPCDSNIQRDSYA